MCPSMYCPGMVRVFRELCPGIAQLVFHLKNFYAIRWRHLDIPPGYEAKYTCTVRRLPYSDHLQCLYRILICLVVLRSVVISLVLKAEEFEHETITGKIKISHKVDLLLFVLLHVCAETIDSRVYRRIANCMKKAMSYKNSDKPTVSKL